MYHRHIMIYIRSTYARMNNIHLLSTDFIDSTRFYTLERVVGVGICVFIVQCTRLLGSLDLNYR